MEPPNQHLSTESYFPISDGGTIVYPSRNQNQSATRFWPCPTPIRLVYTSTYPGVDIALFDDYTALFSWDAKADITVNVNTYMHATPVLRMED